MVRASTTLRIVPSRIRSTAVDTIAWYPSAEGMAVTCDGGNGSAGAPPTGRTGAKGRTSPSLGTSSISHGSPDPALHTRRIGTCIQA